MRKVCIVTGTRAEWGLLAPVARELQQRADVKLCIIATNMHLDRRRGYTLDQITADGFKVDATVPMEALSDSQMHTAMALGACTSGMAQALEQLKPDILVLLGDRSEAMATAMVAQVMRIPIVHLHGGETSQGAIDDNLRHAITKLSALHLTSTSEHRQRVIQMGEHPDRVLNIGAVGVDTAMSLTPMSREELEEFIQLPLSRHTLLLTYHPVTASTDSFPSANSMHKVLSATARMLESIPDSNLIITYPNNDSGADGIIKAIETFAADNPNRVRAIPSMGQRRYLSTLRYIGAVAGNSSSGIIEVPSAGIPTVDIGPRQKGRISASSVIHCPEDTDSIYHALMQALSAQALEHASHVSNPYHHAGSARMAAEAIATFPLTTLRYKTFYDINT